MALPPLAPATRAQLVKFDLLVGTPTALGVLRRRLSTAQLLRALTAFSWRNLMRDPLAGVSKDDWPAEQEPLVRRQLKPVLLLDDVLRLDLRLEPELATSILAEVVRVSGARFIEHNVPAVAQTSWEGAEPEQRTSFVQRLSVRLFNARVEDIETSPKGLSFSVTACRFVQLTHALGRPHLASMFCAADSQFFDGPDTPRLTRPTTIAGGDSCCRFEFSYPDANERNHGS